MRTRFAGDCRASVLDLLFDIDSDIGGTKIPSARGLHAVAASVWEKGIMQPTR